MEKVTELRYAERNVPMSDEAMSELSKAVTRLDKSVSDLSHNVHEFQMETVRALGEVRTEVEVLKKTSERMAELPPSLRPTNKLGMDGGQTRQLVIIVVTLVLSALGIGVSQGQSTSHPAPRAAPGTPAP